MLFLLMSAVLAQAAPADLYHVKLAVASADSRAEVRVGEAAPLEVVFDVKSGAHISDEAPLTLKLTGDGVTFEKPVLHYADAQKPAGAAPHFREVVTATAPGAHEVDVDMSFYVCTAELCNRATEHRKMTLSAK